MTYSIAAADIFDRVQRGKENAFAICWQKGLPAPVVRCGNISGELLLCSGRFQTQGENITFDAKRSPGNGDAYLLIDRKQGSPRFALIADGAEVLNSEMTIETGFVSAVACQQSGKGFAVVACWSMDSDGKPASSLLAGSDDEFISHAIALLKLEVRNG